MWSEDERNSIQQVVFWESEWICCYWLNLSSELNIKLFSKQTIISSKANEMLKNLSSDSSKRYWRTPSPSSTTSMKSSRYLRSGLFHKNSSKNIKQDISNQPKSKPMLHQFKNQLVQMKQQTYKMTGTTQQSSYEMPSKNQNEVESYGAYFAQIPTARSTIIKTSSKTKLQQGCISAQINSRARSKHRYQQSSRKRMDQNDKLKQDYKELMQKHQNLILYNTRMEAEMLDYKKQLDNLRVKYEQKKTREDNLTQEIAKLKIQLQINNKQLSKCNLENYQMKQQLYELNLQKKLLASKPNRQAGDKVCDMCKSNKKTILSLNNALESKMLEIGRKDSIISSLCTDLHKLDNQLKLYDKPKAVLKKMNLNIQEVNELIMMTKARQLSNRMRAQFN